MIHMAGCHLSGVWQATVRPWHCPSLKGHRWLLTASRFSGPLLRSCQRHFSGNAIHKLSVAQKTATVRGGQCISETYRNNYSKLRWRCEDGHEWDASLNSVKDGGTWCPNCAGNAPLCLETAHHIANERGGLCLSTVYNGTRRKLRYRE